MVWRRGGRQAWWCATRLGKGGGCSVGVVYSLKGRKTKGKKGKGAVGGKKRVELCIGGGDGEKGNGRGGGWDLKGVEGRWRRKGQVLRGGAGTKPEIRWFGCNGRMCDDGD
ncbi:hypothetical protein ES288_D09G125600v1 [Gossypium darwinii]|uniref:Uncharacterized protein n=1 Tax=Gossypium darwinii TaxID=34276 RepID=A0A5D2B9K5_GOSDA|nr:hypothetical protein ES288_D09G125600v1 [Gossypium darwinii]